MALIPLSLCTWHRKDMDMIAYTQQRAAVPLDKMRDNARIVDGLYARKLETRTAVIDARESLGAFGLLCAL